VTDSTAPSPESGLSELAAIEMLDFPIAVWAQADEEGQDLMREFALILLGESPGERDVPARLLQLIEELQQGYGHLNAEQEAALAAAVKRGEDVVERFEYHVPYDIVPAIDALEAMLDEADAYCRTGEHLLSLHTSPQSVAFREWFFDEFRRQVAGGAPTRWAESPHAARVAEMTAAGGGNDGR
jgi:hypothetical protein